MIKHKSIPLLLLSIAAFFAAWLLSPSAFAEVWPLLVLMMGLPVGGVLVDTGVIR